MPRPRREPPASFTDNWPDSPCSDPAAEKVRLFALRLRTAMGGASLREAVAEVDLDYSILSDYLSGKTWPDSRAVALLDRVATPILLRLGRLPGLSRLAFFTRP